MRLEIHRDWCRNRGWAAWFWSQSQQISMNASRQWLGTSRFYADPKKWHPDWKGCTEMWTRFFSHQYEINDSSASELGEWNRYHSAKQKEKKRSALLLWMEATHKSLCIVSESSWSRWLTIYWLFLLADVINDLDPYSVFSLSVLENIYRILIMPQSIFKKIFLVFGVWSVNECPWIVQMMFNLINDSERPAMLSVVHFDFNNAHRFSQDIW